MLTEIFQGAALEWAPRLTLLFLLGFHGQFSTPQAGVVQVATQVYSVLLIAGLFVTSLSSSPLYWCAVTVFHFVPIAWNYRVADNHLYLEGYWCIALAVGLYLGGPEGQQAIAASANGLIALCFAAAVCAKLASASYRDGSFFIHTLIFDKRFLSITHCSGISPEILLQHHKCRLQLARMALTEASAPVPPRLRRMGLFLTWWTIGIELLLAALFSVPIQELEYLRFSGLIAFSISTYLLVPVPAFGMILLLMFAPTIGHSDLRMLTVATAAAMPVLAPVSQIVGTAVLSAIRDALPREIIPPAPAELEIPPLPSPNKTARAAS